MLYPPVNLYKYVGNDILKIINLTLTCQNRIEAITQKSIEHDNGFVKLVLQERTADGLGCRIHFWKPGTFDSNIHSHRWNMASLILAGG